MTTWADVQPGDIVQGKGASLWEVMSTTPDCSAVVLRNLANGRTHEGSPGPDAPVEVKITATQQMEAAEAVATVHLGGQPIGKRHESGRWMAPVDFVHHGTLLGHLHVFHGVSLTDEAADTWEKATALHHALHQEQVAPAQEHVHDPDWRTGRAEAVGASFSGG